MENYWLIAIIITIAYAGQAIFGFGAGLIAVPLVSVLIGVKETVIFLILFQFLNGLLILDSYKNIPWKTIMPMSITMILGTIIGTFILAGSNNSALKIILALSILAFLGKSVFIKKPKFSNKNKNLVGMLLGFIGGLFEGILGIGGPPLTMYLLTAVSRKEQIRAGLISLFFISCLVRIFLLNQEGLLDFNQIKSALLFLPFFFVSIIIGHFLNSKFSEKYYRYAAYLILFISVIMLLLENYQSIPFTNR